MLVCPIANVTGALSGLMLFSTISYLGVALMNVLGLVVLLWMAKSSDVGFSKVFAAFCASCAASVVVGMTVFQLSGAHAQLLWSSVLSIYIVAVVLSEVVAAIGRAPCGGRTRAEGERRGRAARLGRRGRISIWHPVGRCVDLARACARTSSESLMRFIIYADETGCPTCLHPRTTQEGDAHGRTRVRIAERSDQQGAVLFVSVSVLRRLLRGGGSRGLCQLVRDPGQGRTRPCSYLPQLPARERLQGEAAGHRSARQGIHHVPGAGWRPRSSTRST